MRGRWTRWAFVVGGMIVILGVVYLILRTMFTPAIRWSSTKCLFTQFDLAYRNELTAGKEPIVNKDQFWPRVQRWKIDWNSCRMERQVIYDSWKTPIVVTVQSPKIVFRSAGPDCRLMTDDDVVEEIPHVEPPAEWRIGG
jgi:hypothetical protein